MTGFVIVLIMIAYVSAIGWVILFALKSLKLDCTDWPWWKILAPLWLVTGAVVPLWMVAGAAIASWIAGK
jgi:hypothetical protein